MTMVKVQKPKKRKMSFTMSNGDKINGLVNIKGYDRASDYLQDPARPFIIVFDVVKEGTIGATEGKTVFLNKTHIIFAE